jgi:predicted glycogen debranching enzyme
MHSGFERAAEWLEADGLGGFASGPVSGPRTRRYHALLLAATTPPTGRVALVNGFEARLETDAGCWELSSQRYTPDVIHPDGARWVESFGSEPWPRWRLKLADGTRIEQELFVAHGGAVTLLRWRRIGGSGRALLSVRPLLSGRDYHALHHENADFQFEPEHQGQRLIWRPYRGLPAIICASNGAYTHEPLWYRNFLYTEERDRGLDCVEDLAAPGELRWSLDENDAVLVLAAENLDGGLLMPCEPVTDGYARLRAAEMRRRRALTGDAPSPTARLLRAADAYFVERAGGKTLVAGYPWFTDWGRDTFIAVRGLGLASGRLDDACSILLAWADSVSAGMLPNRFPDSGGEPEFNAVDASLWYVIAAHELLQALAASGRSLSAADERRVRDAVEAILTGYAEGTRYGIRADGDGLLACGTAGVQLTWMDAKVGDWVVTPRIGKPVEVQALWINALRLGGERSERWASLYERALRAFDQRFWSEAAGCLYDVVDVDHEPGRVDSSIRPNQIFAVGGLPLVLLDMQRGRRVVDVVEGRLLTPIGLRSLAPDEPGYCGRYQGGVRQRDGAYHQGTVWPWLLGPFAEAWVRVRGSKAAAKTQARRRFLQPLIEHLDAAGVGHIPEIADGDAPHTPRGCPFQAWSVGEILRLDRVVLAP